MNGTKRHAERKEWTEPDPVRARCISIVVTFGSVHFVRFPFSLLTRNPLEFQIWTKGSSHPWNRGTVSGAFPCFIHYTHFAFACSFRSFTWFTHFHLETTGTKRLEWRWKGENEPWETERNRQVTAARFSGSWVRSIRFTPFTLSLGCEQGWATRTNSWNRKVRDEPTGTTGPCTTPTFHSLTVFHWFISFTHFHTVHSVSRS